MIDPAVFWVTGATGRLGCEVVQRLEQLGALPVPLVLDGYPPMPRRWPWSASVAPVGVAGPDDLEALPPPDHTLNLHWCVDRDQSDEDSLLFDVDYNLRRPAFLWRWLADSSCQRFVNVSTIKVFGPLNQAPVTADTDPRPSTVYGLAKLLGERYFDAQFSGASPEPLHIRLCSLAAAGGHPSQLLPQLCQSAFAGLHIELNTSHRVQIMHVAEAADLVIAGALTPDPGPFVVAPPSVPVGRIADFFESRTGATLDADLVETTPAADEPEIESNAQSLHADWTRRFTPEQMVDAVAREHQEWVRLTRSDE